LQPIGCAALARAKRAKAAQMLRPARIRVRPIEIGRQKQKPRLKRAPATLRRLQAARSLQLMAAAPARVARSLRPLQAVLQRTAGCRLQMRATPVTTRTPARNRSPVQLGHRRRQLQVPAVPAREATAAWGREEKPGAVVTRAAAANLAAAVVIAGVAPKPAKVVRVVKVVKRRAARIASSSCP